MRVTPLIMFSVIFTTAVLLDAVKFLIAGKPTVVNWESFVHPAWVVTAIVVLLSASFMPLVHRLAFWVYLIVFAVAYLNVYLQFSETITYFCMLFNLVLTAVFYFSSPVMSTSQEKIKYQVEGTESK